MKNINLLPKVPKLQRIFIPLLVLSVVFFLTLSSSLLYVSHYFKNDKQNVENQIVLSNASIQTLTQQRQMDEQSLNYQNLQAEIDKYKTKRIDWIPVLETISSKLPLAGRILSAEIPKDEKKVETNGTNPAASQAAPVTMNLKLEFANLSSLADYMVLLQSSSLFHSVSILSAVKTEKTFSTPVASAPSTVITNSQAVSVQKDENVKKGFEDTLVEDGNEGDKLLNELKWTMNQQIAKREFGLTLPNKTFDKDTNSQIAQEDTSALTDEDWEDARKTLSEMKNETTVQPEVNMSSIANQPIPAQKFNVYEVIIAITLNNSIKSK